MSSNPTPNLDDEQLPMHDDWDFEYEASTQAHWRRDTTAEELAADSKAHTAEDYREGVSDYYMAYEMTISHEEGDEWGVSFSTPNLQRGGIGDLDPRYSVSGVSLDEALDHVRTVLSEKALSN